MGRLRDCHTTPLAFVICPGQGRYSRGVRWRADDPWPTDSREDRARRVALSYRQLAELIIAGRLPDPDAALRRLDEKWQELAQGWVVPTMAPLDPEAWLAPAELAELLYIEARALRDWHRLGHVRRMRHQGESAPWRYNVGDVIRYYARQGKIESRDTSERDCGT
jgi:hypothetical protein